MSEYIAKCNEVVGISGKTLIVPDYIDTSKEIVRCRDCKEYRASDATCHSWQWHNWDAAIDVEPDGFCAWAKRKEGGDD